MGNTQRVRLSDRTSTLIVQVVGHVEGDDEDSVKARALVQKVMLAEPRGIEVDSEEAWALGHVIKALHDNITQVTPPEWARETAQSDMRALERDADTVVRAAEALERPRRGWFGR